MLKTVQPPVNEGVWRIGRKTDPFAFSRPAEPLLETGKPASPRRRFDSALANFSTGYFATQREAAFAETMALYRPDTEFVELLPDDDSIGVGGLPADWRDQRLIVNARLEPSETRPYLDFVDLEDSETIAEINKDLKPILALFGIPNLTLGVLHSDDRIATSWIATYLELATDAEGHPRYAGIRYASKYGADLECWAVFEGVEIERRSIDVIHIDDSDLKKIAKRFNLRVY